MASQNGDIQTLMELGLTSSQAKVYLSLVTSEKLKGSLIWKKSGVARQDIYRILAELQEKGLVEKIIANPTEYRAAPMEEGVSVLLKKKADEYTVAEKRTKDLLRRFKLPASQDTGEDYQFSLVPEREATLSKFRIAFDNVQKNVSGLFFWEGFENLVEDAAKPLEEALKRGIRIRLIVYGRREEKEVSDLIRFLSKKGYFKIKKTEKPPPASLTIFDEEKVLVTVTPSHVPTETPSLWLNNPGIAAIIADYFELMWANSVEDNMTQPTRTT